MEEGSRNDPGQTAELKAFIRGLVSSLSDKLNSLEKRVIALESTPATQDEEDWLDTTLESLTRETTSPVVQPDFSSITGQGHFGRDAWTYERDE